MRRIKGLENPNSGPKKANMTTISPQGAKVRLGKNMRASLEYAVRTPHKWHDIGKGRGARMAIKRLEKAGLVEVRYPLRRFRVKQ
jgi:hypothetical protein